MSEHDSALRWSRVALCVLLVALLLRTLWAIVIPVVPVSDSAAYDIFAWNIAQGYGYGWEPHQPTAYWPVGTSAIYGLLFWIFGHDYVPVVLFQIATGVAIVAISMAIASRWFGGRIAIVTGWLLACWPLLIQYTTILASEMYFILFVLLAFWVAGRRASSKSEWLLKGGAIGIALAAAGYVRPLALIMAPLMFVGPLTIRKERGLAFAACIAAIVSMSLCILPWTIRNWQVFDRFVPISTNGGTNLWMGNNPSGSIEYMPLPKVDVSNEADLDKHFGKLAKNYILEDPKAFTVRTIRKLISLYDRETIGVSWNEKGLKHRFGDRAIPLLKLASTIWWWCMLLLAFVGLLKITISRGICSAALLTPLLTWGYFTLVHGVIVAGDRYHVPSIPFIAMFAAAALAVIEEGPSITDKLT